MKSITLININLLPMRKSAILFLIMIIFSFSVSGQIAAYEYVKQGYPKSGKIKVYYAASGDTLKIGDIIELGAPKSGSQFDIVKSSFDGINFYTIDASNSGAEITIKKMRIWKKDIYITATPAGSSAYNTRIMSYESAVSLGEIKTNRISSDDILLPIVRTVQS